MVGHFILLKCYLFIILSFLNLYIIRILILIVIHILGKRYSSLSMVANGRKPLMGGNWKLNPRSVADSVTLGINIEFIILSNHY